MQNSLQQKICHLTNQAIQYNHPDYKLKKEETIWSMEMFEVKLVYSGFTTLLLKKFYKYFFLRGGGGGGEKKKIDRS